jgi:hypothetical protein
MDRTFAEVRGAFRAWEETQAGPEAPVPVQAAYEAMRAAARRATGRVVLDARAWSNLLTADADFEQAVMRLLLALACDAWCQGTMAAREQRGHEAGE